jgi:hypothetical protein
MTKIIGTILETKFDGGTISAPAILLLTVKPDVKFSGQVHLIAQGKLAKSMNTAVSSGAYVWAEYTGSKIDSWGIAGDLPKLEV